MAPKAERIGDNLELGEGPHWDVETQSLYFVDIAGKTVNRYLPATKSHTKAFIHKSEGSPSFIIPLKGEKDKFVVGLERSVVVITWDGLSKAATITKKIADVEPDLTENKTNDGKADPSGRLWFGTMAKEKGGIIEPRKGAFYSLENGGRIKDHIHNVSISNGLAWSLDKKKFYYIDSPERKVFQYDFDIDSGTISNQQTIFNFDKHNIQGVPDGQTIDADGNLWVAVFGGARVLKIDPRVPDTLLETVPIPANQITSVAFGGANLDELYVTSGCITISNVKLSPSDGHGYTYRVTDLGVKGLPAVKVKL